MNKTFLKLVRDALSYVDIGIMRLRDLKLLEEHAREYENDVNYLLTLPEDTLVQLVGLLKKSKSQLRQDLFVLTELAFKRSGFFVEFGATNGVDLSNSHILEKEFGWRGILAEPARCWHDSLRANRSCSIETDCVWSDSTSILSFNEVQWPELSTIEAFNSSDHFGEGRKSGSTRTYDVKTISLLDMLVKYDAPAEIDYLSIDTEGSEYEILSNFDFKKYQFNVITCEHNFTPMRGKLFELLTRNGYQRKCIGLSKWDDWYVKGAR